MTLPVKPPDRSPWGTLLRRDHVVVIGSPGCGKSPFAAALAARARRVVYFDSAGDWSELGERVPASVLELEHFRGTFLRLVVTPDPDAAPEELVRTIELARAARDFGGLVLLVDEVGSLAESFDVQNALRALHRNGHKDGLASILVSPCWTDIPARCRSTASRVVSFAQRAEADVRALNAELGRVVPGFGDRAATWTHPQPPVVFVSPTLH